MTENPPSSPNTFDSNLSQFRKVWDVLLGKGDFKSKINSILNPDKPQTSSNISLPQVQYVVEAYYLAECYPESLGFLKKDADNLLWTMMSLKGWGIDKVIEFQNSLRELTDLIKYDQVRETRKKVKERKGREDNE